VPYRSLLPSPAENECACSCSSSKRRRSKLYVPPTPTPTPANSNWPSLRFQDGKWQMANGIIKVPLAKLSGRL